MIMAFMDAILLFPPSDVLPLVIAYRLTHVVSVRIDFLYHTNAYAQVLNVKKAALLAAKAMQNWVVPKVEDVVDSGEIR